jgi:hypothetical protein
MREDFRRMVLETIDRKISEIDAELRGREDKELAERRRALENLRRLVAEAGRSKE